MSRARRRAPLGLRSRLRIVGVPRPNGSHRGGYSGAIRRRWVIALDCDYLVENSLIVRKPRRDEGFDLFVHAAS